MVYVSNVSTIMPASGQNISSDANKILFFFLFFSWNICVSVGKQRRDDGMIPNCAGKTNEELLRKRTIQRTDVNVDES